jgi:ligand-binding sensor domain-containing protein/two-component sensor histidine kinase
MSAGWPKYSSNFSALTAVSLLICLLFDSSSLFSQNIDNLNIEKVQGDGLKNNYILSMGQDKNGFMWFGTLEGLFRYDGYNFTGFDNTTSNSQPLINKPIGYIYPENNNLWVGYVGGISVIDINTKSIKLYPSPGSLVINCIYPKNDSIFWIGSNVGLFQFDKRKFKWKKLLFLDAGSSVNAICDDKKGHLYLLSTNGICTVAKSTGKFDYFFPHLPVYPKVDNVNCPNMNQSVFDGNGNLWISTWGGGLLKFNPGTHEIKQWMHPTDDLHFLPYYIALDILADKTGNIWLANKEGGLTIFNTANNKFTNYPVEWQSEIKMSSAVTRLFRDRWGVIWIGTENGIFKYDQYNTHLSKTEMWLKTDTGVTPAHMSPITMLKDNDGLLWMGMYSGIFIFDQKNNVLLDYNKVFGIPPNLAVFNIIQDSNGSIWFNAKNRLVKVLKKGAGPGSSLTPLIYTSPEIKSSITDIYIDHEKRMWIATHKDGIFRFDRTTKKFIAFDYKEKALQPGIKEAHNFCELSKDSLLVGGVNTGLILLHTNSNTYEKIHWENLPGVPDEASINGISKIGSDLWIGTEYNGLWKTDVHFKKPLIITVDDGLPSMDIESMVSDKQNNLWILTNSGAVKFQTSSKKITVFDKRDGILDLDELNTLIIDDKNNVMMGSRGCLYNLIPSQIVKNTTPPKVFITNLKIFDKDYSVQRSGAIELSYTQNYFSLEYVALNYTRSKFNRYAYKMEGLDKKWNDAGSRRYVSYANLDEGTYTFNVKACNNEGVWNNLSTRLVLIINPPFWHRWWFYSLIVLLLATIIYTIYAYNINQLKLRLQMRDKIARDLHDDIGSTLSGINIFSKIALQKMSAHEAGGFELVEKISDRSQKTLDALSDIVWSINTRNDGMDNFLMKANEYLAILEAQGIGFDFSVDQDMEHMKFGMILRRELYLIFKEAVCNASKYANCSFIKISLTHHKETCTLIVKDNGKGFIVDSVTSGNGIYNMQQRAKKMNGELHIRSKENEGTTVTLNFRITRFR